jgi:para-nitrobenzyl esterase
VAGDPSRSSLALLRELDIPEQRLEALWDVPADRFVPAQAAIAARGNSALNDVSAFAPAFDGETTPLPLAEAFARGASAKVPLMLGTTRDEINLFLGQAVKKLEEPLEDAALYEQLRPVVPGASDARITTLIDVYRCSRSERKLPHGNRALSAAITSDALWRVTNERFLDAYRAQHVPAFLYLFTYESPAMRGALRSCHALDLPFMFGTLDGPGQDRFAGTGERVHALSRRMMDVWLTFARTGDPSLREVPGGNWPAYQPEQRPTMVFDLESGLQSAPYEEERAAWTGLTPRALIG